MKLQVTHEDGSTFEYSSNEEVVLIGRSKVCGLRIRAEGVSREHMELHQRDGEVYLKDLGSANGSYVNEEKIESHIEIPFNTLFPVVIGKGITIQLMPDEDSWSEMGDATSSFAHNLSQEFASSVAAKKKPAGRRPNPLSDDGEDEDKPGSEGRFFHNRRLKEEKDSNAPKILIILAVLGFFGYKTAHLWGPPVSQHVPFLATYLKGLKKPDKPDKSVQQMSKNEAILSIKQKKKALARTFKSYEPLMNARKCTGPFLTALCSRFQKLITNGREGFGLHQDKLFLKLNTDRVYGILKRKSKFPQSFDILKKKALAMSFISFTPVIYAIAAKKPEPISIFYIFGVNSANELEFFVEINMLINSEPQDMKNVLEDIKIARTQSNWAQLKKIIKSQSKNFQVFE